MGAFGIETASVVSESHSSVSIVRATSLCMSTGLMYEVACHIPRRSHVRQRSARGPSGHPGTQQPRPKTRPYGTTASDNTATCRGARWAVVSDALGVRAGCCVNVVLPDVSHPSVHATTTSEDIHNGVRRHGHMCQKSERGLFVWIQSGWGRQPRPKNDPRVRPESGAVGQRTASEDTAKGAKGPSIQRQSGCTRARLIYPKIAQRLCDNQVSLSCPQMVARLA